MSKSINKKSNKNKLIVDKYELNTYAVKRIYVLKNYNKQYLDKYFKYSNGDNISLVYDCDAAVYSNIMDKDNKICSLVLLNPEMFESKEPYIIEKVCAHEAFHVAVWIYDYIGQEVSYTNSNEPFAYLLEHIFYCILKTAKK